MPEMLKALPVSTPYEVSSRTSTTSPMSLPRCMRFWRTSRSFTDHRGTDSDLVPRRPDSIQTRSRVMR
jgi:hypothetical protein